MPRSLSRLTLFVALALLYLTGLALAADAPPPPDVDAAGWLKAIYMALTSKNWGLVVGLGLIALVYPLRRFGPEFIKSKTGGLLLAFGISLAATFGAALAAGAKPDIVMIITALTTAATAAGFWEWIKDHLPGAQAAADKVSSSPVLPAAKFTAIMLVALAAGCAHATPIVDAAGHAIVDCTKQDASAVLVVALELVGDAAQSVVGTGPVDWNKLVADAEHEGSAVGQCAFAEFWAALHPPAVVTPDVNVARAAVAPTEPSRAALEKLRTHAGGVTWQLPAGRRL